MMARLNELDIAARVGSPSTATVRERLVRYMADLGLGSREVGERIGYGGSSLRCFIRGDHEKKRSPTSAFFDERLCRAIWKMLEENSLPSHARKPARLFPTENYRRIQSYFNAAVEHGEVCLLFGPPGTSKTFCLEHLVAERDRKKLKDAIYVYATCSTYPLALLKRIGSGLGIGCGTQSIDSMLARLLARFSLADQPPAIIVDEAQHLNVAALEVLRELHDRSGCGLVLAGSHDLYEKFLRGRAQLEQWLSRIDHKEPLPGLQEKEVHEIAARELGNGQPAKLSEKQLSILVQACRVDDIFARDADGKPEVAKYLSVRRLVKLLAQYKAKRTAV
jgi:DNA transposition AAA+ family ATPase